MRFVKMHGLGNDYVYVDMFHETLPEPAGSLARKISDRHFGVGSDGLILVEPSETCDVKMSMYNSDGSRGSMCGNGIRCVGKFAYDAGICRKPSISVETDVGVKHLELTVESGVCTGARVDMGEPAYDKSDITVECGGVDWKLRRVSMGNPHAVCFLSALPANKVFYEVGPALEKNPIFPERANIEFCEIVSREAVKIRVWERGSGETLCCGTGACAGAVAGALAGLLNRECTVEMPGGKLFIEWRNDGRVYMTGPAEVSFTGVWPD